MSTLDCITSKLVTSAPNLTSEGLRASLISSRADVKLSANSNLRFNGMSIVSREPFQHGCIVTKSELGVPHMRMLSALVTRCKLKSPVNKVGLLNPYLNLNVAVLTRAVINTPAFTVGATITLSSEIIGAKANVPSSQLPLFLRTISMVLPGSTLGLDVYFTSSIPPAGAPAANLNLALKASAITKCETLSATLTVRPFDTNPIITKANVTFSGFLTVPIIYTDLRSFGTLNLNAPAISVIYALPIPNVIGSTKLTINFPRVILNTLGLPSSSNVPCALSVSLQANLYTLGMVDISPLRFNLNASANYLSTALRIENPPLISTSFSVNPISNANFLIGRIVTLASSGADKVYVLAVQSSGSSTKLFLSTFALQVSAVSTGFIPYSRLEIPLKSTTVNVISLVNTPSQSLNTLNLPTSTSTFVNARLNLNGEFLGNVFLTGSTVAAKTIAYGSVINFSSLALGNSSVSVARSNLILNSVPIPAASLIISQNISLSPPVVQAKCRVTGYLATAIAGIDFPSAVHEQVRYPIGTASSYASPKLNDIPVFYSHGVFGTALLNVNPGSSGSSSLSALLRIGLALNSGDYYETDSVQASSMLVLFRVSVADTSSSIRSAFGTGRIGADLTRLSTNSQQMPTGYTGSVTDIGSGGTTELAFGNQFADGRLMDTSSQNGRFFVASALVRHNYNSADSTTVPLSVATDFNYPTTNTIRLSRARLETTVKDNDEVGLSPIYSTIHMGVISDSDFDARYSSAATFSLNAASIARTTPATTQHIHSSDSMFAFLPMKAGVRYQFNNNYRTLDGIYTVESSQFMTDGEGNPLFVVGLRVLDGDIVNSDSIPGVLKLRIRIYTYRSDERFVLIDVPILGRHQNKFVIDSSYRWFIQSVMPTGAFYNQADILLTRDEAYTVDSSLVNDTLIVTRPNLILSSLPASEQGSGDQGESNQALLSTTNDRNLLIGEFSLEIKRSSSSSLAASARVNLSPVNSEETYNGATNGGDSISSNDPSLLQLIIDQAGNLRGKVKTIVSGTPIMTDNINSILPNAVKLFIAANGKFSKVVVGQHNIGLLTVPTTGNTGRKLFLWGSNVYGHLIPPDNIHSAPGSYQTFLKEGYIDNVLDFDIAPAYICIITDIGIMRCWGCARGIASNEGPWAPPPQVPPNPAPQPKEEQCSIGGKHMLMKIKLPATSGSAATSRIYQYGNLNQNIPYVDGWASNPDTPSSYDYRLVACGVEHAVAIRADGTLVCWGDNSQGQCTPPGTLSGKIVKEVAAGDYHTVAMDSNGVVYAWGSNAEGQTDIGSVSNLKAKSVFAGGKYSGVIRAITSTDVTPTPNSLSYSDVEDTVLITGDNSRYIKNVPLCEGLSYDPSYPRFRMKFHKVVAGWDHAIGIRKVESDVARFIHPELCRFINNNNIRVKVLTAQNTVIFGQDENITDSAFQSPLTTGGDDDLWQDPDEQGSVYYPGEGGKSVNGNYYRFKREAYVYDGCPGKIILQKNISGGWQPVIFRSSAYDEVGHLVVTNDDVCAFRHIKPVWFGDTNSTPYWAVGINAFYCCQPDGTLCYDDYEDNQNILSTSQSTLGTGEKIDLDFSLADVYGDSNTDQNIVCWGNPIAYHEGYVRSDYATYYGVPAGQLSGIESDSDVVSGYVDQVANAPRIVSINDDINGDRLVDPYFITQTCSYLGRLDLSKAITNVLWDHSGGYTLPAVYAPFVFNSSTYSLYLGPSSAYLIPTNNTFGGIHTPMIVRTTLTGDENPENCILNAILPTEGYGAATPPKTNAFYSCHNSTIDKGNETSHPLNLNSYFGVAQGTIKALMPPDSATLLQTTYASNQKWIVLADSNPLLNGYNWGSSPTGYWYVYNNTVDQTVGLALRYYNLTGICPYTTHPSEHNDDVALCPFEPVQYHRTLSLSQLQSLGLDIRRFRIVQHMTKRYWNMTEPSLQVKAGKHLSQIPLTPVTPTTGLTAIPTGVVVEESSNIGFIPMINLTFGVSLYEYGYRSIYIEKKQSMSAYTSGTSGSRQLFEALPQGDNSQGQLTTSQYYKKFSQKNAFGPVAGVIYSWPVFGPSWFMSVGQLTQQFAAEGQTFTKVSCGQYHALALDTRGKVYAWGSNNRMGHGVNEVVAWNPTLGFSLWYSATMDTNLYPEDPPNWWENYSPNLPIQEIRQESPLFIPYPSELSHETVRDPTDPLNGMLRFGSASFWSGSGVGSAKFSQAGLKFTDYFGAPSSFRNFRNGGFSIGVVSDINGMRFELGTGLNEAKIYSSYFDTDISQNLQLISWSYEYGSVGGLTFKASTNGKPVTWSTAPEDTTSPPITFRDPNSSAQIIGNRSLLNLSLKECIFHTGNGRILQKMVAGKDFIGFVFKFNNPEINIENYLISQPAASELENYEVQPGGFLDISVGCKGTSTDLILQKVSRNYTVINTATHNSSSPYYSAQQTVAHYSVATPYKIFIGNDIVFWDSQTVTYTDLTPPTNGYLIWPRVVFPTDSDYSSPYAYHPKSIGLFRFPNYEYEDPDYFHIVELRDASVPVADATFDIDQLSMYYEFGDLLGTSIVYDSSTKRVIPQRYTPKPNLVPPTATPIARNYVMAWAYTGFAVSQGEVYSWGINKHKTRSYNNISYDPQSAELPYGITGLTCPSKSNTTFNGAGIVPSGDSTNAYSVMHVWGQASQYNLSWGFIPTEPGLSPGNKVWENFTLAAGGTAMFGFKKVVVADVGNLEVFQHPNLPIAQKRTWFFGINKDSNIKFFKVQPKDMADNPVPANPKIYLRAADYNSMDSMDVWDAVGDYVVPAEVASLNIADVEMAPNAVIVRTTDGRVFCWGDPSSNFVSSFNDLCHECAASFSAPTAATTANPSPKTKLNSAASTNPVIDIAVSAYQAAALRQDGSVLIWGAWSPYTVASGIASLLQQNNPFKTATPSNTPRKLGSNAGALAVIRDNGLVQVWLNDNNDPYRSIPSSSINLGGSDYSKLTKNPSAFNFISLSNTGDFKAWGLGGLGQAPSATENNYGQSAIPRNLFSPTGCCWDTLNSLYRQSATVNSVALNTSTMSKILVTHKFITGLNIPSNILAIPDQNPVSASEIQSKVNVVDIAAGRDVMFAITNAIYGATSGSIVKWSSDNFVDVPTGNNWSKIESSCPQNLPESWSHAAAIDSSGNLRLWGVAPYWATNQSPPGNYKAITCTNYGVVALKTDNTLAVFENLLPGATSSVSLPPYLQNVTFKQVSGGENHVVATVLTSVTVNTPDGQFALSADDVVAWGDNSNLQCNIPGYEYGSSNNLPVQSEYVAAGTNFSVYHRVATGITHPVGEQFALAFYAGIAHYNMLVHEAYMVHSTDNLCSGILDGSNPYFLNAPWYTPDPDINEIQTTTGHSRILGWTTNATTVPSDFRSTSTSNRKAKLIFADRFKGYKRGRGTISSEYFGGAGYSVIVEEGYTDNIVVFGGEQIPANCTESLTNAPTIAIRQIPTLPLGTKIVSIHSHRGYIYALSSEGVVISWGYQDASGGWQPNYFSLSNDSQSTLKRNLCIPRTSSEDSNIIGGFNYGAGGPSIGASYIVGVPGMTTAWAADVSINRYFNGNKTTLKRYAATGSSDKVDISQGVNFAQGFMALDTWPGIPSALDTYYTLDIKLVGGALKYKVRSASLMVMNLDSKNSIGQNILKEATPNTDESVADFAVVSSTKYLQGRVPTQVGSIDFDSFVESQSGFTLDYISIPENIYPAYLRNFFGGSAKIELIDLVNQSLFLQGRIAEISQQQVLNFMNFTQSWATAGIVPQEGTSTTSVTNWTSTTQSNLTPIITPTTVLAPHLVPTFTTGKKGIKLRGSSFNDSSRLFNSNTNISIPSAFTYFIVKRAAADSTGNPQHPHTIFTALQTISNNVYLQGIGQMGKQPGIIFRGAGTSTNLARTSAICITLNTIQIINAYYGGPTDKGIRVDGDEKTLETHLYTLTPQNPPLPQSGYYLGAPLTAVGIRQENTEVGEVLVFDRRLSLQEIQRVEGYLAWQFGIQSSLPTAHPYKNSAPSTGSLDIIKPFSDDPTPDQFFDVGVAASNAPQTWLTLYDVTAEYRAKRMGGSSVKDEHAPLIVELELDSRTSAGLLTVTNKLSCKVNNSTLQILLPGALSLSSSYGRLAVVNSPNTFEVINFEMIGAALVKNKLTVSATLTISKLNLQVNALNLRLKFMAGINCEGIYGCEDVDPNLDPNLLVVSPSYNLVPILTRSIVLSSNLVININFRYLRSACVFNCFGSLNLASSISGSAIARLNASANSLNLVYENLARDGGCIARMKLNVRICDARGFIVNNQ